MVTQEAKHTPAPWIMEHDEEEGTVTVWAGSAVEERHTGMYDAAGEMQLYSTVYFDGDSNESDEECLANGRLIAAAPKMLATLRSIARWCADPSDDRTTSDFEDELFQVIGEATGETTEAA